MRHQGRDLPDGSDILAGLLAISPQWRRQTKMFHTYRKYFPQRRGVSSEEEEGEVDSEVELPRRRYEFFNSRQNCWIPALTFNLCIIDAVLIHSACLDLLSLITSVLLQASCEHEQMSVAVNVQLRELVSLGRGGGKHQWPLPQRHAGRGQHQHRRPSGRQERRPAVSGLRDPRRSVWPDPAGLGRAVWEGGNSTTSQDPARLQWP